jgi:hypothetical protein
MMFDHLSTNLTNWKRACELGSEPAALIRSSAARAAAGGGARGRQGAPRSGGGLVRPGGAHGAFPAALARNCGPTAIAHVCSPGPTLALAATGGGFGVHSFGQLAAVDRRRRVGPGAQPSGGIYAAPRAWSAAFGKRRPPRSAFELASGSKPHTVMEIPGFYPRIASPPCFPAGCEAGIGRPRYDRLGPDT